MSAVKYNTLQEVFTAVVTHLLNQGERSVASSGNCLYRSPDGRRCAVGAIIPDELYSPVMENSVVQANCVWSVIKPLFASPTDAKYLLEELQAVHDDIPPHDWEEMLRGMAQDKGFHMPTSGTILITNP
jgi:hypothetical protein